VVSGKTLSGSLELTLSVAVDSQLNPTQVKVVEAILRDRKTGYYDDAGAILGVLAGALIFG
jgi:hypothetical protein